MAPVAAHRSIPTIITSSSRCFIKSPSTPTALPGGRIRRILRPRIFKESLPVAASEIRGNDAISVEVIRQPNDDLVSRHLAIEHLLRLRRSRGGAVFNPWWQCDAANDIGLQAPGIRRRQLRAHLSERIDTAELVLVGEARPLHRHRDDIGAHSVEGGHQRRSVRCSFNY